VAIAQRAGTCNPATTSIRQERPGECGSSAALGEVGVRTLGMSYNSGCYRGTGPALRHDPGPLPRALLHRFRKKMSHVRDARASHCLGTLANPERPAGGTPPSDSNQTSRVTIEGQQWFTKPLLIFFNHQKPQASTTFQSIQVHTGLK